MDTITSGSWFVRSALAIAATLLIATGSEAQDPERSRAAASVSVDTIGRVRSLPLGLPIRDSLRARDEVLGQVDADRAPLLSIGSALDALSGRVPGVSVHHPSNSPGRAPRVALFGRAPGDRATVPLHVLDGVPLVGPPDLLGSWDIEAVDVVTGHAASAWLGSLARDGMVSMHGRTSPWGNGLTVRARVLAGASFPPPSLGIARHHDYLVNDAGQYIDEMGNVVERDQRVREAGGVMATPYAAPLHDPLRAVLRTGSTRSAWIGVSHRFPASDLSISVARDRIEGILAETDPFSRTHLRGSASHAFGTTARVSVVAHRAWADEEMSPRLNPVQSAALFPADVDLRARDADGEYVFRPDPEVFAWNPLFDLTTHRPQTGSRSVLGAQGTWSPLSWLRFDGGVGYDAIRQRASSVEPRRTDDGTLEGDTLISSYAERASLRTLAFAATTLGRLGPFDASFALSFMDAEERESTAEGQELRPPSCPDVPDVCFDGGTTRSTSLDFSRRSFGAHASGAWGRLAQLSLSGRREENAHFPAWDRWRTHYRGVAAVDVAGAGWWRWSALDALALSVEHGTASGMLSRQEIRDMVFEPWHPGGIERFLAERETRTAATLRMGVLDRIVLEARHDWARVRNAPLAVGVPGLPGGRAWRSSGKIDRRSVGVGLEAALMRDEDREWIMSVAIDRHHARYLAGLGFCGGVGELRCAGMAVGTIAGIDWFRRVEELPAIHVGSADAFAVNDDGLLVPVGVGGSLEDPQYGTVVTIDGVDYPWGLPFSVVDEFGYELPTPLGTAGDGVGLGWSTHFRWRALSLGAVIAGRLGGEVYDDGAELRYIRRTHPDLDQTGKAPANQKPYEYYDRLRVRGLHSSWFLRDASQLGLEELYVRFLVPSGRLGGRFDGLEMAIMGRNLVRWSRRDSLDPEAPSPGFPSDDFRVPRARSLSLRVGLAF